ncbi:MAG: RecB family exonuclease [Thermodesulfobacteriota bacterium]
MRLYSPTQISTFESCPQRYKFRYIDRICKGGENIEAFMGKRVHETIQKLYKDLVLSKENSLEDLLYHYRERWRRKWHTGISIVKEEYSEENYLTTGERCIKDYYKKYYPFDDHGRTIGLELKVEIPLDTKDYTMVGFMDRLVYAGNGIYEIHDYKTSATLPDETGLEQDRQLPLYQIAVEAMWKDVEEVRLIWHFLAFDKEVTSTRSIFDLNLLKEDVKSIIGRIKNTTSFAPVESPLCKWCEYRTICPIWTHLNKLEAIPEKDVIEDEGVDIVDRFVSLMERRKVINEELQSVKEALIYFADREGAQVIFGTDYTLRIKREKGISFPSASDEPLKRDQLEIWLKESKRWMEVSRLDTKLLEDVIKQGKWSKGPMEKLKEYTSTEDKVYFYPSQLKEEE